MFRVAMLTFGLLAAVTTFAPSVNAFWGHLNSDALIEINEARDCSLSIREQIPRCLN